MRWATELARRSGKTLTAVVIEALRRQLQEQRRDEAQQARLQELMEIGRRCAAHIHHPVSALEHGDLLYNETGLPK